MKVRGITSFNKYMWVNVSRMSYENWVPTKTMGDIIFNYDNQNRVVHDFGHLKNDLDSL